MDGVINLFKERGFTSHDAVACVRGILKTRKVGHAGTLDPLAEGVLVVCVGKGTRAVPYLSGADKVYRASLKLGIETDTQDGTGAVVAVSDEDVSEEALLKVLPSFTGRIRQVPPMYSAVKVKGKKLYELARKGIEVERAPREVVVYGIDLLGGDPENKEYEIRVKCSKGTYIRTLCHDIGRALGVGAVMTSLLREKSGGFDVGDAVTLSGLERLSAAQEAEKALIPLSALFPELPAVVLPEGEERLVKNGVSVAYPGAPPAGGGKRVKVFSHAGEFLMLAFQAEGKNGQPLLKMEKSFY